jgi:hypothetical protein
VEYGISHLRSVLIMRTLRAEGRWEH